MNNKDYSQIDHILDEIIKGISSEEKLADFISHYTSEELINELQAHRVAASAIQRNAVIDQVSDVHKSFFEKRKVHENSLTQNGARVVKRSFGYWWSAAAILIVIPVLAFLFVYATNTSDRLFASQYQAYKMNVDRTPGAINNETIIRNYQNGNYNEVVKNYGELASQSVRDKMVAAFSYMELNNYEAAIPLLDGVIRSNGITGNKLYQDEAEYYLALSYLKANRIEQSYQLFNKIYADDEHTFNGRVDKWFMMRLQWLRQRS